MSKIIFSAAKRQDMVPIIKMHTIVSMMDLIMLILLKLMMLKLLKLMMLNAML